MSSWVAVVAALLFGLVAFAVSERWYRRSARRRDHRLAGRDPINDEEFFHRYYAGTGVRAETCAWARRVVARAARLASHEVIRPTDAFASDLAPIGWDDAGIVEIARAAEDHVGASLPDRDFESLSTVDDLIGYVDARSPR